MSILMVVFLLSYAFSSLYLISAFLYDEYKIAQKPEWQAPFTYGDLAARLFVAFFPLVNMTITVCFLADFIGKKAKKVLKKPVFKVK